MIRLYFQQALYHLRENPIITWVSVLGTALAICMIMVLVITFRFALYFDTVDFRKGHGLRFASLFCWKDSRWLKASRIASTTRAIGSKQESLPYSATLTFASTA